MRRLFKNWNTFELSWLLVFTLIGIGIALITKDSLLNFVVLISGILCVILAAKSSIWNYAAGMINTISYAFVAYSNDLFGELGLYTIFFFPMNIIGFIMWKNKMEDDIVEMRSLQISGKIILLGLCIPAIFLLGALLSKINHQNLPFFDSASTILSIIATILMVMRYEEQWILYLVLNLVTILLWIFRMKNGSSDGPMMIVMWSAFLVNAFYGYHIWHKGARQKLLIESNE